jgi:hypothetical protein
MANTHEHLEHAEHAEHHAGDPFNQRVAVSMAIVAAVLAGISMVGHRTHNQVLQLQGDANRYRTEAANVEVEKANLFAWYQSKRQRQAQLEMNADNLELIQTSNEEARKKKVSGWRAKAKEYGRTNKGEDPKNPEGDNLPDLLRRGNEAGKRAEEAKAKATEFRDRAEHTHHQADRFDVAHLSAEIGLVLCSIALLTKKRAYWFTGLAAAAVAVALTASAYAIPHEHHDAHDGAAPHAAPSGAHPTADDKGKHH